MVLDLRRRRRQLIWIYAYRLNIAAESGKDLTKVKPIWSSQPVKPFTNRATVDALAKRAQAYEQHLIDNPPGNQFEYPPIEESTPHVPIEEPITEEQLESSIESVSKSTEGRIHHS